MCASETPSEELCPLAEGRSQVLSRAGGASDEQCKGSRAEVGTERQLLGGGGGVVSRHFLPLASVGPTSSTQVSTSRAILLTHAQMPLSYSQTQVSR